MGHLKTKFRIYLLLVKKVLFLIASIVSLQACYYDKEEELYPNQSQCDTLNVTYSGFVATLMQNYCNNCHSATSPSAGVNTATYSTLAVIAANGKLKGVIFHEPGFSPMPKGQSILDACSRKKVQAWVNAGYLNN